MILRRLLPIAALAFIAFLVFSVSYSTQKLTVSFLDVGQGDSIFIEGPTGVQLLIDGGADRSVLRGLGSRMAFYDRSIDYVVATHADQDHIGGLVDVVERYTIGVYIESGVVNETPVYRALEKNLMQKNVMQINAFTLTNIDLGGGAYARVLFPERDVSGVESNTASIVLQVVYGNHTFLLTGDAPKNIEWYLTAIYGSALKSDVLKLGHHGSNTSSDEIFIETVSPMYAVVSAGRNNRYGHPHQSVVSFMRQKNIPLLSTAETGNITFITDGISLWMR